MPCQEDPGKKQTANTRTEKKYQEKCTALVRTITSQPNSQTNEEQELFAVERLVNMAEEQRKEEILRDVISWVERGNKPEWQDISKQGQNIEHYWHNFDLLEIENEKLLQKVPNEKHVLMRLIVDPESLRKCVFEQLHSSQ
ncbi:LOW QUALITY PROTEIN: hypothetical protein MAR_016748 [Mya arenaria]|uniref:Uncharacterized protein n=1 Tax=Mya arenaria TaxID=6604 RepID=A0ABY7ECM9_MYAAR|nr:LOW QUALITY PROTEIN: hypothetical protein MAR_016748 [Mya arenaria]